jgi:hypothetical protein
MRFPIDEGQGDASPPPLSDVERVDRAELEAFRPGVSWDYLSA